METIKTKSIGRIVAEDYRTAQVFRDHNIDFCCKGNRSIMEIAEKHSLDPDILIEEIEAIQNQERKDQIDFNSWPPDLLADYIEKKHHRYVEEKTGVLKQYLEKLCRVHGERHPELYEIADHFNKASAALAMHMKKEELVLFPAVRRMVAGTISGEVMKTPYFGSVSNPIKQMMEEHETEGDRFREIQRLSDNYNPPADACTTYRVAFSLLKEFEEDLHTHIHLENNILFPKAAGLERKLEQPVKAG